MIKKKTTPKNKPETIKLPAIDRKPQKTTELYPVIQNENTEVKKTNHYNPLYSCRAGEPRNTLPPYY